MKKTSQESPYANKVWVVRDHVASFVDKAEYERAQRAELRKQNQQTTDSAGSASHPQSTGEE